MEKKSKNACLKEHVKGQKKIERESMEKSNLLNVKSMVFGNEMTSAEQ